MSSEVDLVRIKDSIEALPHGYQVEVGRIMCKNKVRMDENRNGIFVNLSDVPGEVIAELADFLGYVDLQESHLRVIESAKNDLKVEFFNGGKTREQTDARVPVEPVEGQ
jgi:hypothetical protein